MISHAFVINIPTSTERYKLFQQNVTNIPIERLDGVDGTPYLIKGDSPLTSGIIGCMKASINAIKIAKEQKYENVMIFDDDAELCDDFDNELNKAMSELPEDWTMLRLHISTTGTPKKESFSEHLNRVYGGTGTYGYILNSKYYDTILSYLEANYRKPSTVDKGHIKTYDVILQEMMNDLPFFETKKRLVYHRDGYSDRLKQVVNYGLNKPLFCKTVNQEVIKIYYPLHVMFHAERLCKILNDNGYKAVLVREVNPEDENLYIIYCAFQIEKFPKNYIAYQCEQWQSHWFSQNYWHILRGAVNIWEWSLDNVNKYYPDVKHKVIHVPTGLIDGVKSENKDIDVLFYGAINRSLHRKQVLKELQKTFKIEIVDNLYGHEMLNLIARSKVVLNLHYYSRATLEMFRINETLCCQTNVVSERTSLGYYPNVYRDLIYYGANNGELRSSIRKALNSEPKTYLGKLDNSEFVIGAIGKIQNTSNTI